MKILLKNEMTKKVLKRQSENEIRLDNMNVRENFQSSISQHQKLRMQLNQQHKKNGLPNLFSSGKNSIKYQLESIR